MMLLSNDDVSAPLQLVDINGAILIVIRLLEQHLRTKETHGLFSFECAFPVLVPSLSW